MIDLDARGRGCGDVIMLGVVIGVVIMVGSVDRIGDPSRGNGSDVVVAVVVLIGLGGVVVVYAGGGLAVIGVFVRHRSGETRDHQHADQHRRTRDGTRRPGDRSLEQRCACSGGGGEGQHSCDGVGECGALSDPEAVDERKADQPGHEPAAGSDEVDPDQRMPAERIGTDQADDRGNGLSEREHDEQAGEANRVGMRPGQCGVHHRGASGRHRRNRQPVRDRPLIVHQPSSRAASGVMVVAAGQEEAC